MAEPASLVEVDVVAPEHRVADALVDILSQAGAEVVFGLPGGTIAPIFDALLDRPKIRAITTLHEGGALFAASGYAWATGGLGVAAVTSGPGILNAMNGIASAHCDRLPLLVLAGEIARGMRDKRALQDGTSAHLDILGMASPISKLTLELSSPEAAPAMFRHAIAVACAHPRGPVVLTIPVDVSRARINVPELECKSSTSFVLGEDALLRAAQLLSRAKRPAIFVGSGARAGRGPVLLLQLAERLQVPVFTTPKAKGVFPENHPLSLGVYGHGGHDSVQEFLAESVDVLLAAGTGMSDPATNNWNVALRPTRHLIQIDVDPTQLGRNYPISLGLVGPVDQVLNGILSGFRDLPIRVAKRFGVRRTRPVVAAVDGAIYPHEALQELQNELPADTIFTSDIGEHLLFATHHLETSRPDGFLIMTGLASMGSGIGGALGVQVARPSRRVVSICGDGGFSMCLGDVATAARERLPLVFAVLNDKRFGMVELGNQAIFGRTPDYSFRGVDLTRVAEGLGAEAHLIEKAGQIARLSLARPRNGPVVLDIRISRQAKAPKHDRFQALSAFGSSTSRAAVGGARADS